MPYDVDKPADLSSMKEKLEKTYSGVDDKAVRQAIHVWNSVMDSGGDEGRAWASVYSKMNQRGLSKKGSAARVASRYLVGAAPTLKLLADTLNRMARVTETNDVGRDYTAVDAKVADKIIKRWLGHAEKEGGMYSEVDLGGIKEEFTNTWSLLATIKDTFKSGSKQVWISWEGSDKLYVKVEREFRGKEVEFDVSITDRNGRIVFDSDSTPKATPSQIVHALVLDRPRFVSNRVWKEENDYREERVEDWASDVTPWD